MIKYIGSKRLLVGAIADIAERSGASSVLDLFSGTSRVGHALKKRGFRVVANDHNSYAHTIATCYVQSDRGRWLSDAERLITELDRLPGRPGWFTETYAGRSRYLHPSNAERVDAIRDRIAGLDLEPELESICVTSLIEAADRVDSTAGVQMAYLKQWAPRASRPLRLRVPELLDRPASGPCAAHRLDALDAARRFEADLVYIDPPYNQHSYLGNYHVWETIARWDQPETYGVACKRVDVRTRRSRFNSRPGFAGAMRELIAAARARTIVVSFSDEGFLSREDLESMLGERGAVRVIEHDNPRYVGAKIGIHNPRGERVGSVGRLRNREMLFTLDVESATPCAERLPAQTIAGRT